LSPRALLNYFAWTNKRGKNKAYFFAGGHMNNKLILILAWFGIFCGPSWALQISEKLVFESKYLEVLNLSIGVDDTVYGIAYNVGEDMDTAGQVWTYNAEGSRVANYKIKGVTQSSPLAFRDRSMAAVVARGTEEDPKYFLMWFNRQRVVDYQALDGAGKWIGASIDKKQEILAVAWEKRVDFYDQEGRKVGSYENIGMPIQSIAVGNTAFLLVKKDGVYWINQRGEIRKKIKVDEKLVYPALEMSGGDVVLVTQTDNKNKLLIISSAGEKYTWDILGKIRNPFGDNGLMDGPTELEDGRLAVLSGKSLFILNQKAEVQGELKFTNDAETAPVKIKANFWAVATRDQGVIFFNRHGIILGKTPEYFTLHQKPLRINDQLMAVAPNDEGVDLGRSTVSAILYLKIKL
jgi:hypothetical protein